MNLMTGIKYFEITCFIIFTITKGKYSFKLVVLLLSENGSWNKEIISIQQR